MEKEKEVRCFIDDEEVDCQTFQEVPIDEEEWMKTFSYGGSAET